jgi:hypothetical protein
MVQDAAQRVLRSLQRWQVKLTGFCPIPMQVTISATAPAMVYTYVLSIYFEIPIHGTPSKGEGSVQMTSLYILVLFDSF